MFPNIEISKDRKDNSGKDSTPNSSPKGRDGTGKFTTPDHATRTDMVPVRGPRKNPAAQSNSTSTSDHLAIYLPQAAAPSPQKKSRGKGKTRKVNNARASTPESEFVCFSDSETESDRLPIAKRRKEAAGISNYQPHNVVQIINAADRFKTPSSSG